MSLRFHPLIPAAFAAMLLAMSMPAHADLPQLIPRELLLANPARSQARLSPDGKRLAWIQGSEGYAPNIWVQTIGEDDSRRLTDDTGAGIFEYQWAHDNRHLLYIQDQDGNENWHVYVVDMETGDERNLTPFDGVRAENLLLDAQHPGTILVGLNRRDPSTMDMHRIEISTGEHTLEVENPGDVDKWITDPDFRIRVATALDAETNDTIIRVRDTPDAPWRELVRWPFLEAGSVLYEKMLGFTPDGTGLYVQSPIGAPMTRLVILDAKTGEERDELAADPRSDLWNVWWEPPVIRDPATGAIDAVGFCYHKPEWRLLNPDLETDFERLRKAAEGAHIWVDGRSGDDTRWLVAFAADIQPDRYYLYERESGKLEFLFENLPELSEYTLAGMQGVTYTARDGRTIPAYLTLPPGVEPRGLPMVLLPHGGPWARDDWGFQDWVQLLANRGYAVLQPNFRGSTGYGRDHLNAGNREWGVGAMQHDLTDGVRWAIDQGIADPARVAIMGASYGGYATLSGLAFTPDLYACGVDMVGPSNVKTLFESFPAYWAVRKVRWRLRVGDVEGDPAWNERISPLFHADRIRAPLLIVHGANDPRVMQAESDRIVEAVRANGGRAIYVVYPDEGHGLARDDNLMDFMGRVEEFLGEHLGGRVEPWLEVPGSSAEVR